MKPRVLTRCVANHYAAPNERIAEFSAPNGVGGLISFRQLEDGKLLIHVYRADLGVIVRAGGIEIRAGEES